MGRRKYLGLIVFLSWFMLAPISLTQQTPGTPQYASIHNTNWQTIQDCFATLGNMETCIGVTNIIIAADIDTSSELAGIVSDETGSGSLVFGTSPTLTTPILSGTFSSLSNFTMQVDSDNNESASFFWNGTAGTLMELNEANGLILSVPLTTQTSNQPSWIFDDSDTSAETTDARIRVDATNTGVGTEEAGFTFSSLVASTVTDLAFLDGTGFRANRNVVVTTGDTASPTCNQLKGTMHIADNATAANDVDYTLPEISTCLVGANACFYDNGAGDGGIIIDAAAGDEILLDGTGVGVADAIDSPGVAGTGANGDSICLLAIDNNTWITLNRTGTWVDGGAD